MYQDVKEYTAHTSVTGMQSADRLQLLLKCSVKLAWHIHTSMTSREMDNGYSVIMTMLLATVMLIITKYGSWHN